MKEKFFNLEKGYNLTKGGDNVGEICKKLTEEQVQEIKQKLLDGKTQTSISKDYNVSQTVISYINLGIEYYHEDWDYPIRKRKIQQKIYSLYKLSSKIQNAVATNKKR